MIIQKIENKKIMKQKGLTLIELMIVVVIIGVIAAIALPSYQNYIEKSRRADATTTILKIAAEQEKYYLQNNRYATTAQMAAKMNSSVTTSIDTQSGHYNATLASADVTRDYTITATAIGAQLNDKKCRNFTYTQSGIRGATSSTSTASTDDCW